MSFDLEKVARISKLIEEVSEVIGVLEVWIEGCPVDPIKVKIRRLYPSGMFEGIANYSIKNPTQADAYRSMNPCSTAQEAFEQAIIGFLAFYKPELADQTEFVLDEKF